MTRELLPEVLAFLLVMSRTSHATSVLHSLVELPVAQSMGPEAVSELIAAAVKVLVAEAWQLDCYLSNADYESRSLAVCCNVSAI